MVKNKIETKCPKCGVDIDEMSITLYAECQVDRILKKKFPKKDGVVSVHNEVDNVSLNIEPDGNKWYACPHCHEDICRGGKTAEAFLQGRKYHWEDIHRVSYYGRAGGVIIDEVEELFEVIYPMRNGKRDWKNELKYM